MYKQALVAIELGSEPAWQVLERACAFARDSMSHPEALHVVHVVEPQYVEYSFDLIILGSHGREGLRALLGSTATATLHQAPVDVMTVRIRKAAPPAAGEETKP